MGIKIVTAAIVVAVLAFTCGIALYEEHIVQEQWKTWMIEHGCVLVAEGPQHLGLPAEEDFTETYLCDDLLLVNR